MPGWPRRHHLATGLPAVSADALTATLVGLHATDPATPYLSLWARIPGCSVADVHAALYEDRTLIKHLAMRRTLWVVRPGDLPAIQSAASDRVAANEHRRLVADVENAGVAADGRAWLAAARSAVLGHLGRSGPCTARQLREALPELTGTYDPAPGKTWGGEGHLAPRVLTLLSARGEIVRGPNDGGWTTSRPRWVAARRLGDPCRRRRAGGRAGRHGPPVAVCVRARPPSPMSSGGSATPSAGHARRCATSRPSRWTWTGRRGSCCPVTTGRTPR